MKKTITLFSFMLFSIPSFAQTTCPSMQLTHTYFSYGNFYQCIGIVPETKSGYRSPGNIGGSSSDTTGEDCTLVGNVNASHHRGTLVGLSTPSVCNNYCTVTARCDSNGNWVDTGYTW